MVGCRHLIPIPSHKLVRSAICPSGDRFGWRSVKPSASPTLVRTQHLPHNENCALTRGDNSWPSTLGIRLHPRCTEVLWLVFPMSSRECCPEARCRADRFHLIGDPERRQRSPANCEPVGTDPCRPPSQRFPFYAEAYPVAALTKDCVPTAWRLTHGANARKVHPPVFRVPAQRPGTSIHV